jgi:hypothetical protein
MSIFDAEIAAQPKCVDLYKKKELNETGYFDITRTFNFCNLFVQ